MTALQELVSDLRLRGVSLEIVGGERLAIDPVEALKPDELATLREYKEGVIKLLAPICHQQQKCPGDDHLPVLAFSTLLAWGPDSCYFK